MRKSITCAGVFLVLSMAFAVTGCSVKASMRVPNTKFVYPNSNVEPLGHVSAESKSVTFFVPKMVNAEDINNTINKALSQKGGDVMLNSKIVFKVTMFPVIPIMINSLEISGTAAKMVVGKQELH